MGGCYVVSWIALSVSGVILEKNYKLWYINSSHQDWVLLGPIETQSKNKQEQKKRIVPAERCLRSYLTSDMVGGELYNQIDNEKEKKEKNILNPPDNS